METKLKKKRGSYLGLTGLACKARIQAMNNCFFLVQSKTIQGPDFYLFAFKVSLEIKRSRAVTLVPIAPPGGRRVQSQVQPFPQE